jgi:ribonuclease HI
MGIIIATDGSCIQQGGFAKGDDTDRPGACGFVARLDDGTLVGRANPYANGTIGKMEIKGLLMGLKFAEQVVDQAEDRILIKCDSQFVVNGFNDWLVAWAAKGRERPDGLPHKKGGLVSAEDWGAIQALKLALGDKVKVEWVKGHSGDPMNDRVDELVNGCARKQEPVFFQIAGDAPKRVRYDLGPVGEWPNVDTPSAPAAPEAPVDLPWEVDARETAAPASVTMIGAAPLPIGTAGIEVEAVEAEAPKPDFIADNARDIISALDRLVGNWNDLKDEDIVLQRLRVVACNARNAQRKAV